MKDRTNKIENVYKKLGRKLDKKTIKELLELNKMGKINYKPNYQRNFVWNVTKSTTLIESVLINGEIPPITIVKTPKETRIMDGRQRYETLLRFYNNKFKLNENGIKRENLKDLRNRNYEELPENLRKMFLEYKFKVIEYTSDLSISEEDLNLVERDLFMRYNYGMTALTTAEIARAKYLYEYLTMNIERKIKDNEELYNKFVEVLIPDNKLERLDKRSIINLILINIRKMIVTSYIPIIGNKSVRLGTKVINKYYDTFIINGLNLQEKDEKIKEFIKIFEKIYLVKNKLEKDNNYLKDNIIFFQTLYWMFDILYKIYPDKFYKFDIDQLCHYVEEDGKKYFDNYENWTPKSIEVKYNYLKEYINKVLKLNIDDYLEEVNLNKRKIGIKRRAKIESNESWNKISEEKQIDTYLDSLKIYDIIDLIKQGRFIIRSDYQRGEVKSTKKASKIIESILLGVKLPPIYAYVTLGEDGLDNYTVLDGQQRLISILSFMGEDITGENSEYIKTIKNKYALTGLKDYEDLNGITYEGENYLNPKKRSIIDNYTVEFIRINKQENEKFDPIEMFLRLNENPCPIKTNSFEMWNCFDIVNCIKEIKEIAKYKLLKQASARMLECELVTVLAYMNYKEIFLYNVDKFLSIYICTKNKNKRNEHNEISLKVKNKGVITNFLEKAEIDSKKEEEFLKAIKGVREFTDKLKILSDNNEENLIKIFNPYTEKPRGASKTDIHIIYLILKEIDLHRVKTYKENIMADIAELFKFMKNMPDGKDEKDFKGLMEKIIDNNNK